jgi:hypothetical protein
MSTLSPILNLWGMLFLSNEFFVFSPCSVALWWALAWSFWRRLNRSAAEVSP